MNIKKKFKIILNTIVYSIRFFGKDIYIHPSSFVSRKAIIMNSGKGKIVIGKNCEIHQYSLISTYGGKIFIGNNCSLNPFSIIYGHGGVKIGDGVRIACHSVIIPANHIFGSTEKSIHESGLTTKGIIIHNNVWVGSGCRILDGVSIGDNSVISAGSVVNKFVETNTLVGGVPARTIKKI
jgi:acetyltransferase-like isoleucine patch superfamily enzyme